MRSKRGKKPVRKSSKALLLLITLALAVGSIVYLTIFRDEAKNPVASPQIASKQLVGKVAPDFSLESNDGTIRLSDLKGKYVILFFSEGVMCYPACWDQMIQFWKDERFNTSDVVVLSIIVDTKSEWAKATKQKPELAATKVLFDTAKSVSSAYDVLSLPSSMHPRYSPGHTYFIIDKEGIIRYTLDDPNMGIRNDILATELEIIRQRGSGIG